MPQRASQWAWAAGSLIDPQGGAWTMTRQRLDLRIVRRALRSANYHILQGHCAGCEPVDVGDGQRAALWEQVRHSYRGPGGSDDGDYTGDEYTAADGRRLVYIEAAC